MCALMFYKTALLVECLITNITIISALTTTYIIAVTAFTVVYMKLLINCTLVKHKRKTLGNILIEKQLCL